MRTTHNLFRRVEREQEKLILATMPRLAALVPAPAVAPQAKPLTYTLAEVAHA